MQENRRSKKSKRLVELKESEESCFSKTGLPPGFRFQPTDQQLISYYLYNKVTSNPLSSIGDDVKDFDLYSSIEPWEIWDRFGGPRLEEERMSGGKDGDLDLFFYTTLKKVSSNGSNFARKVGSGAWQGDSKLRKIFADDSNKYCVGSMRRLRYENKKIAEQHGGWILHEFSLEGSMLPSSSSTPLPTDFVVCRFRKNDRMAKVCQDMSTVEEYLGI